MDFITIHDNTNRKRSIKPYLVDERLAIVKLTQISYYIGEQVVCIFHTSSSEVDFTQHQPPLGKRNIFSHTSDFLFFTVWDHSSVTLSMISRTRDFFVYVVVPDWVEAAIMDHQVLVVTAKLTEGRIIVDEHCIDVDDSIDVNTHHQITVFIVGLVISKNSLKNFVNNLVIRTLTIVV